MKTLIFRNDDSSTRVDIQVDIFASNEEVITPGFETRFTNMYIAGNTDTAKALGIDSKEIENSFSAIVAKAKSIDGIGLFMIDASYPNLDPVAQVDALGLSGTGGIAQVEINGGTFQATFNTDLATTANDFVTAHATDLLNDEDIIVTHPLSDGILVFESNVDGKSFTLGIANSTGDLDGSIQNVILNQGGGEVTLVPTNHPVV